MVERVQRRGVIVPSIVFAVIAVLMLSKEIPILTGSKFFTIYLIGRIGVISGLIVCSILAYLENEFVFAYYPLIFFTLTLFYECHGQYFQPNYWLAYIQVTNIFPFIFYVDKRLLAGLFTVGLVTFDTTLFVSSDKLISLGIFTPAFLSDVITGTVISTLIAYIGASVIFEEKMKRNQIYQRFIDLGKNISSIVHDIKGMISGPCSYSDLLQNKSEKGAFGKEETQLITYLNEDIHSVREFVLEMNLLVSTHSTDREKVIKVSDVVKSVKRVFKSKIKKIQIELIGDMTLKTKVDYLNRIMVNSIINSCDAIHKNNVKEGKVIIFCEDYLLGISDNSGEQLDHATLKKLNSPYVTFSSKEEGSGIGILIIKDYINALGGKFKYYNQINGVNLAIRFPKKIIITKSNTERRSASI